MKIKYPAEAFALGMVLFSAGMKEAFAAGCVCRSAEKPAGIPDSPLEPHGLRVRGDSSD